MWQKIRRPLQLLAITGIFFLIIQILYLLLRFIVFFIAGLISLIFRKDSLKWTGFLNKTLWDWMQILLVPLVVAIVGFELNRIQKSREQSTEAQNKKTESNTAEKRAQIEQEI